MPEGVERLVGIGAANAARSRNGGFQAKLGMFPGFAPLYKQVAGCSGWSSSNMRFLTTHYGRIAALSFVLASLILLPTSEASARCWYNGWGWRCGPGLLALPFVAAGAVVIGAAAVATAPIRAIIGPPYYRPLPAYYVPPGYVPPGYYAPPGYYYVPSAVPAVSH